MLIVRRRRPLNKRRWAAVEFTLFAGPARRRDGVFGVEVGAVGEGVCANFFAIDFTGSPFAKAMRCDARRLPSFEQRARRHHRVIDRAARRGETTLEGFEVRAIFRRFQIRRANGLSSNPSKSQRPLLVVGFIGRQRLGVDGLWRLSASAVSTCTGARPPPRRCAEARRHSLRMKFLSETMRKARNRPFSGSAESNKFFFEEAAEKIPARREVPARRAAGGRNGGHTHTADTNERGRWRPAPRRIRRRPLSRREDHRPARVRKNARRIAGRNRAVHAGNIVSPYITGIDSVVTQGRALTQQGGAADNSVETQPVIMPGVIAVRSLREAEDEADVKYESQDYVVSRRGA